MKPRAFASYHLAMVASREQALRVGDFIWCRYSRRWQVVTKAYQTIGFIAERYVPPPPPPPATRLVCDACGPLAWPGKHRSLICRFLAWMERKRPAAG